VKRNVYQHIYWNEIEEKLIAGLGNDFKKEFFDDFYIDFALLKGENKYAIELDGPVHYLWPSKAVNQTHLARKKHLEWKCWTIFDIPFFLEGEALQSRIDEIIKAIK